MTGPEPAPIRGLPGRPPEGERILWQGGPDWRSLALHALHARKVAIYFAVLAAAAFAFTLGQGEPLNQAVASAAWPALLGLAATGLLTLFAWLSARSTIYTLTSRRVAIAYGVALPMTVNIPYRSIATAALAVYPDGTGDIPLALATKDRLAWLVLWPHVRPWRLRQPEPMLRSVPEAAHVAAVLGRALVAAHQGGAFSEPRLTPANDVLPRPAAAPAAASARRA